MKETGQRSNFVNLDFYYIPSYSYSAKFIDVLKHVFHKLRDRVLFEPHIVTFTSKADSFIRNNCIGNGNYCAFEPDENDQITGRDILMESIR